MIDWVKRMIERCMERRESGVCDTCHLRKVCIHKGIPMKAARNESTGDGSAALKSLFGAFFEAVERRDPSPVARKVREQLEARLESGNASADAIATALGMTRATMYRRLKAERTSYEHLLEGVRQRLARRYLGKDGESVKATAYRLGFSDPAAFSRAFKRWTGTSPSEYRA
jgi:AraC-like DNA-binding protein